MVSTDIYLENNIRGITILSFWSLELPNEIELNRSS